MRPDHREELASAVEGFLADIRRLARVALQQQRDRFLGTAKPARVRPAAKPKTAVTHVARNQPRKIAVDAAPTRAPAPVTRRTRKAATDIERTRPPLASPPARARAAVTKRARPGTIDLERKRRQPAPPPIAAVVPMATPTPAAVPVPAVAEPAVVAAPTPITPATSSSRCRGTVKWFDAGKGYGFIRGDDGLDAFVHHSAVSEAGFRDFNPGQAVEYEIRRTPKGLQAVALGAGHER
jgi:CspA family cold shock protein